MASDIMRWSKEWSAEDHASFEALCFHRVDETGKPYTELLRAPEIGERAEAEEIVRRAFEMTKDVIALAYADRRPLPTDWDEPIIINHLAAEPFARAISKLSDRPGRVASLVSTMGPGLDMFECNTMHQRGGLLNSYYSGPFSSGAVWDSFWFFENPYGEDSSVSFTTYHLTKNGLAYCLERWPERVEELRKIEEAGKH